MALLFIDGMGHYDSTQISAKYTALGTTNTTWEIVPEGRFNNCLKRTMALGGPVTHGTADITPLMTQTGPWVPTISGVMGFAVKITNLEEVFEPASDGGSDNTAFWAVYEGSNILFYVTLNKAGTLTAWLHRNGVLVTNLNLGTTIQGLQADVWSYLEFTWLIDNTAGYLEIRNNGTTIFRHDGDTLPSDIVVSYTGVWTTIRMLHTRTETTGSAVVIRVGDLYLADLDGSGDEVKDFLGDVIIDQIVPDGVGAYSNWSPNTADNWDAVEEVPPDGDTTYVTAQTTGTRDSYTLEDVPLAAEILGYQTLVYARKETEGGASISPTLRIGGVDYDADAQGLGSPASYEYLIQPYDTNPATLAKITPAEINAAEGGILKVI